MSNQETKKEVIEKKIHESASELADGLSKGKDYELRCNANGLTIYEIKKKRFLNAECGE